MNLADKMTFTLKCTGHKYILTAFKGGYRCNVTDMPYDLNTNVYSRYEVINNFNRGEWLRTDVSSEPELNFPIVYTYAQSKALGGTIYKVEGCDKVVVICNNEPKSAYLWWDVSNIRRFIKNGTWLVQASGMSVEQPTSHSTDGVTLDINIDNSKAIKAVDELTNALNDCEAAYKRLREVMKG